MRAREKQLLVDLNNFLTKQLGYVLQSPAISGGGLMPEAYPSQTTTPPLPLPMWAHVVIFGFSEGELQCGSRRRTPPGMSPP
jgi:hypothetical protein